MGKGIRTRTRTGGEKVERMRRILKFFLEGTMDSFIAFGRRNRHSQVSGLMTEWMEMPATEIRHGEGNAVWG